MGQFDRLLIRDSDSDSSDEPALRTSPPNGSVTAAGAGEVSPTNAATAEVNIVTGNTALAAAAPAISENVPPAVAEAGDEEKAEASVGATGSTHHTSNGASVTPEERSAGAAANSSSGSSYTYSYSDSPSEAPSEPAAAPAAAAPAAARAAASSTNGQGGAAPPLATQPLRVVADQPENVPLSASSDGDDSHSHVTTSSDGSRASGAVLPVGAARAYTSGGFSATDGSPANAVRSGLHSQVSAPAAASDAELSLSPSRPFQAADRSDALEETGAQHATVATPQLVAAPPKKKKKSSLFSCLCCGGSRNAETESDNDDAPPHPIVVETGVHRTDVGTAQDGSPVHEIASAQVAQTRGDGTSQHSRTGASLSHASATSEAHQEEDAAGAVQNNDGDDSVKSGEPAEAEAKASATSKAEGGDSAKVSPEATPKATSDAGESQGKEETLCATPQCAENNTDDRDHAADDKEDGEQPVAHSSGASSPAPSEGKVDAQEVINDAASSAVFEEVQSEKSSPYGFRVLEESPVEGPTPQEFNRTSEKGLDDNSAGIRERAQEEASTADPYAHLPLYQRRILLDQRARERREAEELASQWRELTFHPNLHKLTGGAVGARHTPSASQSRGASAHTRGAAASSARRPSFSASPLRHRPEVDATKEFSTGWYKTRHAAFADLDADDDSVLVTHLGAQNVQAMHARKSRLPARSSARLPARRGASAEDHEPLGEMPPNKAFHCDAATADDSDEQFVVSTPPRRMTKAEQDELFTRLYGHRTVASASRSASPGQSPRQSAQVTPRATATSPCRQRHSAITSGENDDDVFNRLYNLSKSPRRVPSTTPEKDYSFHPHITDLARQQASGTHRRSVVDRLYPTSPPREERPVMKVEALMSTSGVSIPDRTVPESIIPEEVRKPCDAQPGAGGEGPSSAVDRGDDDVDSRTITSSASGSSSRTDTDGSDTESSSDSDSSDYSASSSGDDERSASEHEAALPPTIRA